jgi:hypothetical protein
VPQRARFKGNVDGTGDVDGNSNSNGDGNGDGDGDGDGDGSRSAIYVHGVSVGVGVGNTLGKCGRALVGASAVGDRICRNVVAARAFARHTATTPIAAGDAQSENCVENENKIDATTGGDKRIVGVNVRRRCGKCGWRAPCGAAAPQAAARLVEQPEAWRHGIEVKVEVDDASEFFRLSRRGLFFTS